MSGYRKNTHEVTDSYGNTMTLKDGLRVRLNKMGPDPNPVPDGMEGTIRSINDKCADDIGQIFIKWDNGRTLALDPKVDEFVFLPNTEDQIDLISHLGETKGPITKKYTKDLKQAFSSTKPKVKIKTETKKVKKSKKELEEMDAAGSGGLAGAGGYSYSGPLSVKKESVIIKIKDLMNEETTTYNTDYTDGTDAKIWADKNKDGWYWNDKPLWSGGEIVDLMAKVSAVWDDENLDISKEWDKIQEKDRKDKLTEANKERIHTKKWDRCVKAVEKKNKENGTNYTPEDVCTSSIGYEGSIKKKHRRKEETIEENYLNEGDNNALVYVVLFLSSILAKIPVKQWPQYLAENSRDMLIDFLKFMKKFGYTTDTEYIKNNFDSLLEKGLGKLYKKNGVSQDLGETTTFASVWGVNGPPVGPAFVAKKGKHIPSKKPIWKGGQIIQKIENDGVLNESKKDLFTEINKVKFTPTGGKYVKIKDRCAKFNNKPWCSQGAIDNPLELSDNTFENIKNISKQTGLSEEYILNQINKELNTK